MSEPFDMEVFLGSVMSGSQTTRQRHLRQAKAIQAAIAVRWHRDNPWTWRRKHLVWFLSQYVNQRAESTRYYYIFDHNHNHASPREVLEIQKDQQSNHSH